MSTRLQVILSDDEIVRFRACAERDGLNLSAWVRMALAMAERTRPRKTAEQRLAALRQALEIPADERVPMPPMEEYRAWHKATRYDELPEP